MFAGPIFRQRKVLKTSELLFSPAAFADMDKDNNIKLDKSHMLIFDRLLRFFMIPPPFDRIIFCFILGIYKLLSMVVKTLQIIG